jgi:hypothetical protein
MKFRMIILGFLLQTTIMAGAQVEPKPVVKPVQYFIGVQPGVMPILFDEYGRYAWDVNLVPITLEYAINRHWALRVHTIWDIELRPYNFPSVAATLGVEIATPCYLSLKNSEEGHRGFFISPVITPGYNRLNKYYSLRAGGEAGFSFLFGYKWSISLSIQAGTELQKFPKDSFVRFVPYTIPVIALGIWL